MHAAQAFQRSQRQVFRLVHQDDAAAVFQPAHHRIHQLVQAAFALCAQHGGQLLQQHFGGIGRIGLNHQRVGCLFAVFAQRAGFAQAGLPEQHHRFAFHVCQPQHVAHPLGRSRQHIVHLQLSFGFALALLLQIGGNLAFDFLHIARVFAVQVLVHHGRGDAHGTRHRRLREAVIADIVL